MQNQITHLSAKVISLEADLGDQRQVKKVVDQLKCETEVQYYEIIDNKNTMSDLTDRDNLIFSGILDYRELNVVDM